MDLEDALGAALKSALGPGGVGEEPSGLGEALVAALSAAAASSASASSPHAPLLPATVTRCGLAPAIAVALRDGVIALDPVQRSYLEALLGGGGGGGEAAPAAAALAPASSSAPIPDPATRASLAAAVTDVLPTLGAGYATACLAACGWDPEATLARLLEGDAPPGVSGLDPALAAWEPPAFNPADPKGKGKAPAVVPVPPPPPRAPAPQAPAPPPPAAVSHRSVARFLQGDGLAPGQRESLLAATRASIAAFQAEEEEEGDLLAAAGDDDDFDEEEFGERGDVPAVDGLSDAEGGGAAGPSTFAASSSSRRPAKQWVVGGRVYNYKKEGAIAVAGKAGVAAALEATAAAAAEVHGLGPGGNKAGGSGPPVVGGRGGGAGGGRGGDGGRGRGRGRGGRGRGGGGDAPAGPSDAPAATLGGTQRDHAHAERHKAAAGNHNRRDRAAKKAGGGML